MMTIDRFPLPSREWVWLLVTATALLVVTGTSAFEGFAHAEELRTRLAGTGRLAPVIFIALFSLLTAMGTPRMVMYPLAGLLFGFAYGLLWSLLASLFGAYAAFLYARWGGRGWIYRKWPKAEAVARRIDGRSALKVAIIRQLPSPGFLTNLLLGISTVSHTDFLLGSAFGMLPSAIPTILIGSSLSLVSDSARLLSLSLSAGIIVLLWITSAAFIRYSGKEKDSLPPQSAPRAPEV